MELSRVRVLQPPGAGTLWDWRSCCYARQPSVAETLAVRAEDRVSETSPLRKDTRNGSSATPLEQTQRTSATCSIDGSQHGPLSPRAQNPASTSPTSPDAAVGRRNRGQSRDADLIDAGDHTKNHDACFLEADALTTFHHRLPLVELSPRFPAGPLLSEPETTTAAEEDPNSPTNENGQKDAHAPPSVHFEDALRSETQMGGAPAPPHAKQWLPHPEELEKHQHTLETLLCSVYALIKKEYVLEAHREYELLLEILYKVLEANDLSVLILLRPPGYLSLNSCISGCENPNYTTGEINLDEEERWFCPGGNQCSVLGLKKKRSLSVLNKSMSQLFLRSPTIKHPKGEGADHDALIGNKTSGLDSVMSWYHLTQHVGVGGLEVAPLGFGVLAEPMTLCPRNCKIDLSCVAESGEGVQEVLQESSLFRMSTGGTSASGEKDAEVFKRQAERLLGRKPIHRRVWSMEEVPCIVFTTKDTGATHGVGPTIAGDLCVDRQRSCSAMSVCQKTAVFGSSGDTESFSGSVGGLRLPMDFQVVFTSPSEKDILEQLHTLRKNAGDNQSTFHTTMKNTAPEARGVWDAHLLLRLHHFLERLVNNPQFHRLRIQFMQTEKALRVLAADVVKDKAWSFLKTKTYKMGWRMLDDGNAMCVLEGQINSPLFQCLSLLQESDLHKEWIPFLSASHMLYQVSKFSQVVQQRTSLPWPLDDRESLLVGCAVDCLSLSQPSVIMNGTSIPDDATSLFGLPLTPPGPGFTRLRIKFFTFQLAPDAERKDVTLVKFILYVDPQMNFVPRTVQAFIARQTAGRLFTNVQDLCKRFNKSVYAERVERNPQIYDMVRERLNRFYARRT